MSKKIFIITSTFDRTVDFLIDKYRTIDFVRLNIDKIDEYQISITDNGVLFNSKTFKTDNLFDDIKSIYFRKIFLPELTSYEEKYHNYMQKEIYSFIVGMADSFEGKMLTSPAILRKVENKLFQYHLAKKLNFLQPKSIISNDSNIGHSFIQEKWICKPLSTGKISDEKHVLTNFVKQEISNLELSPTYFQEAINKDFDLRITVINGDFFCVKISSNKIDWRNDTEAKYEKIETPIFIKEQCQNFLKECNLQFGAFDYVVSGKDYYFLECNPNGQWLWLELKLGLPISDRIMEYLNE